MDSRTTGVYAGILSLIEVGLGGLLHGLKVPLAGTLLSLNQSLFLTRVVKLNQGSRGVRTLGFRVSNITSILKSLSPSGKKLLPMLAISAQGLLFSLGTLLFGPSILGCVLGAGLSSFWGVVQPLAILFVVYGAALGEKETQRIILYFNQLLGGLIGLDSHDLWRVVVGFAVLKCLIAMTLAAVGWRASVNEQDLLNHRLLKWGLQCLPSASTKNKMANPFSAALRELFRPLFLIPFVMTGVFLWFAEDSIGVFIRKLLQPIAFAYLILIVARMLPVDRWIKEKGWGGTALATALKFLSDKSQEKSSSVEKES